MAERLFTHGLSAEQLGILKTVLAPYADQITRVDLFGSRALGVYQSYSDIDLVLHGPVDEKTVDRLWTLFWESNLSLKVDVKAYELVQYLPLKAHMDEASQVLFTQAELLDASAPYIPPSSANSI